MFGVVGRAECGEKLFGDCDRVPENGTLLFGLPDFGWKLLGLPPGGICALGVMLLLLSGSGNGPFEP